MDAHLRLLQSWLLDLRNEFHWLLARALEFLWTDSRAARRKREPGFMLFLLHFLARDAAVRELLVRKLLLLLLPASRICEWRVAHAARAAPDFPPERPPLLAAARPVRARREHLQVPVKGRPLHMHVPRHSPPPHQVPPQPFAPPAPAVPRPRRSRPERMGREFLRVHVHR